MGTPTYYTVMHDLVIERIIWLAYIVNNGRQLTRILIYLATTHDL